MNRARKSPIRRTSWLGALLVVALPQPTSGDGPCNPARYERRVESDDGYRQRRTGVDPYCEGEFNEPVAGHRQAKIVVCEYSLGPRPLSWKEGADWRISWPTSPGRSLIHGCHRDLSKQYEIDGEKTEAARAGAQTEAQFTWLVALAERKGFMTTDMQFRVDVPNTPEPTGQAAWPQLPAQATVFMPVRISAANSRATSRPAADDAPKLRVCIAANRTVRVKRGTATKIGGVETQNIDAMAGRLLDRAAKPFHLQLPSDGSLWRIDIVLEERKGQESPAEPFYVQTPPASFARSGG